MRRRLKITCGNAEYYGIFEQYSTKKFDCKSFIGIPAEINCGSTRTYNAIMVAQYQLKQKILKDNYIFDRCALNKNGWEYMPELRTEAS
jgi:hypothetical protein